MIDQKSFNSVHSDSNTDSKNFPEKNKNFPEKNKNFSHPANLPRLLDAPARIVKENLAAIMASRIVGICADIDVFIDFAGFKLLKKFFNKFLAMRDNNKKITLGKLQNLFDRIFIKYKHCTLTKDAVLFAGEFACAWCFGTSAIENIFAQDSCVGKEFLL